MKKFITKTQKAFDKFIRASSIPLDIMRIIFWKLTNNKIIVINQASGLGDYLWVRNFSELIKQKTRYKIITCVTSRWLDFTKKMDSQFVDVFVDFKDPANPKTQIIFKLFKFDLYIDAIGNYPVDKQIRCKDYIYHFITENYTFDMVRQKSLFSKIITIPNAFKYSLKTIPPKKEHWWQNQNYAVLALGGFTEGEFSNQQIEFIIQKIIQHKMHIVAIGFAEQKNKITTIINQLNHSRYIINTCGMLKNYELPYIINKSTFVITPNTGAYQMALLLNKKTILIEKRAHNTAAKYGIPLNQYINPKQDLKNLSDMSTKDIGIAIDTMMKNIDKNDIDWQSLE